jgi:hypothetical protein
MFSKKTAIAAPSELSLKEIGVNVDESQRRQRRIDRLSDCGLKQRHGGIDRRIDPRDAKRLVDPALVPESYLCLLEIRFMRNGVLKKVRGGCPTDEVLNNQDGCRKLW